MTPTPDSYKAEVRERLLNELDSLIPGVSSHDMNELWKTVSIFLDETEARTREADAVAAEGAWFSSVETDNYDFVRGYDTGKTEAAAAIRSLTHTPLKP